MASSASVLQDNSVLSRIDQALFRFESVLALISGLAVLSLMLLAIVSVGGRQLLSQPLTGYVDWIEQVMPIIAFLGISYCHRLGGHIRMDAALTPLKGRSLWIVEFVTTLLMLVLMVLLVFGSWAHFERAFDINAPLFSRDSSLDIRLPLWPAKLLIPLAFSVLSLRLLIHLWAYGLAIVAGARSPVAVPMTADAATLAAREAELVSNAATREPLTAAETARSRERRPRP
ncbi:MAG: TRAP transporter small permease [Pseudomonadota bacterium]